MPRLYEKKLVVATHNKGKLREFRELLGPFVDEIVSAGDLGLPEPEETGTTFEENALLKARAAAEAAHCLALAEDSGLCVSALGGAPGLHSSRWANGDIPAAMKRINDLIGDNKDRSAYFISVLALVWPDGRSEVVEGRCYGTIVYPPRGTNGFDYDVIFMPDGETRVFAEMSLEEMFPLRHRSKALRALAEKCFGAK